MFEIVGKYNRATVYATSVDSASYAQILRMCNTESLRDSKICMMPDTHASSGCTVGTSLTFDRLLNPSFVGDDIGCGMQVYALREREVDFAALDDAVRAAVPSGARIHDHALPGVRKIPLSDTYCRAHMRYDTVRRSFGTLGGGNHFVEVDRGEDGRLWLVIHSGSRRLGRDVASYHRAVAFFVAHDIDPQKAEKKGLRACEIKWGEPLGSCFLSGEYLERYLHDMRVAVRYASESRRTMGEAIMGRMGLHPTDSFETVHNYIDTEKRILRKGAVSAMSGERLIIPLNMKDGALICTGKGNPDWSFTAPHGSGRVLRRSEAREKISLEDFRREMEGVYSTSVNESTIDESPMAYRRLSEIAPVIEPTAESLERVVPVYNFKASKPAQDETADGED